MPIAVEIAPGQASDYTGAVPLLDADERKPRAVIADRGYDADHLRETMQARSITPVIPIRRNRRFQLAIDDHIYALRNRMERCINTLKNLRRIATRYDKTAASYLGFGQIAAIRLWTHIFVNRLKISLLYFQIISYILREINIAYFG